MKKNIQTKIAWLPGLFFILIWPCIVHMERMKTGFQDQVWFPDVAESYEFFLKVRGKILIVIASVMLLIVLDRWLIQRKKTLRKEILIAAVFLTLLYILSTLLSVNRILSLHGSYEQYETTWVLISYLVVFLYFADIMREKESAKYLQMALLGNATIQILIGVGQYFWHDLWASEIGRKWITLGMDYDTSKLSFVDDSAHRVYLSFFNPNYAGVYCLLLMPVLVGYLLKERRVVMKIWAFLNLAGIFFCLWGCGSRSGLITTVLLILLGCLICICKYHNKAGRYILVAGICIAISAAGFLLLPSDSYQKKLFKDLLPDKMEYSLQKIETLDEEVHLVFSWGEYHVNVMDTGMGQTISITDENGKKCPLKPDDTKEDYFTLKDETLPHLMFRVYRDKDGIYVSCIYRKKEWLFVKENDTFYFVNRLGKWDKMQEAESAFGKGYEKALTNRFYLWGRTIPAMKKYWLFGAGTNTFPLIFPQSDYVMRRNVSKSLYGSIITKPHNMYLQTAAQTGILSLLVILFLTFRSLQRVGSTMFEKEQKTFNIRFFFFLSLIGFLIMGITNDAIVVIAPFFWMILGCCYGKEESCDSITVSEIKYNKKKGKVKV